MATEVPKKEVTEEDSIVIRSDYGFKMNPRQKQADTIMQFDFIDKMNIPFSPTFARSLVAIFVFAVAFGYFGYMMTSHFEQMKYTGVWLFLIALSTSGIASFYALVNPVRGSLLSNSYLLLGQIVKDYSIKKGRIKKIRYTGIHRIREDGIIEFSNGDFGRLAHIDGTTSATAYPSEIQRQEKRATSYHDNRSKTTTEIHITSSQKQNAEQQIKSLDNLIKNTRNEAKLAMLELDKYYLENFVNGKKPTVVQYILLRDPSERYLNESIERLERFVGMGFYYSMRLLNKEEADEMLSDFLSFR